MARAKNKWEIEQAERETLRKEFDGKLKVAEGLLDQLADATLPQGKYRKVARERTAEFLSDARRSVRAVRNQEDGFRRR